MIDEDRTMQLFGYTSDELAPKSGKHIVSVCEECGKYRVIRKDNSSDLYRLCAFERGRRRGKVVTEETRLKLSNTLNGREFTEDTKRKISEAKKNMSDETKHKMSVASKGKKHTEETIRKLSAIKQGIPIEEWTGFVTESPYCERFNESCRERNRDKYDRECFLCGKTEKENCRKLSVHHVDMNKNQGCADHKWNLIPLCVSCHARAHGALWQQRIEYMLRG